ncbi:hypothetical protein ACHAQH_001240 [Verticillium albo-atrum]
MRSSAVLFLTAAGLVAAQETVDTTTVTVSADAATVTAPGVEPETTITWEVDTTTIWSGTETETVWVQPGYDEASETEASATETETVFVPAPVPSEEASETDTETVVVVAPTEEAGETATSTWYEESDTITLVPVETTSFAVIYNDISSTTIVTTTLYTPAPNATASGIETVPTAAAPRLGASGAALVAFGAAGLALL